MQHEKLFATYLETADGDSTAVGGLARSVPDGRLATRRLAFDALALEDVDGLLGATHVATFSNEANTSGNECLGLLL